MKCRARVYTKWDPDGRCTRNRCEWHDHYCWQHARLATFGTVDITWAQRRRIVALATAKSDCESEK